MRVSQRASPSDGMDGDAHLLDERVAKVVGRERDDLIHQVMSNLYEAVSVTTRVE